MKNSKYHYSPRIHKLFYLGICLFCASYLLSTNNGLKSSVVIMYNEPFFYDDTIPETEFEIDTTGLVQETAIDGIDTVWYIGESETESTSEPNVNLKLGFVFDSVITINLGNQKTAIAKDLFGFATAGIFTRLQMPIPQGVDTFSLDQWQWMSDLKPQILRFPGGAESKFMDVLKGPGYGYDLGKLIRYYDITDHVLDYPTIADVLADGDNPILLGEWISDTLQNLYINQFLEFKSKWSAQQDLPDTTHKYIDDFIRLVKKIESDDTSQSVKVIYCLDIFSNTATQCVDIIKYLRDSTINHIYPVSVAGVEMGNEPYFDYSKLMMHWNSFDDYWSYINGTNFMGADTAKYKYVLGDSVWRNHDFIGKFKNSPIFTCPVGIPAENLDDQDYALFSPGPPIEDNRSIDEDWNIKLKSKYGAKETITGTTLKRYSFNAIILHPYYDGHNWDTIPINHLDTSYQCNLDDLDTLNDEWLFETYDTRLEAAFDGIGLNFRKFIKTRYKESYDVHKNTFAFDSSNARSKDLWVTEWNFKDQGAGYKNDTINMVGVYSHGFMHGYVVFEWFLKDVKLNFDSGYRTGFHTLSTFHNFAGGGTNAMIHPATGQELGVLGKDTVPYNISPKTDTAARNYLIKMTTFFSFDLLSQITKNNLKYLQTNFIIPTKAINVSPTVFIDPEQRFLYIYYSNIRDTTQNYNITTTGTFGVYPDGGRIQAADTATIYCIQAKKPYSTSGKGNGTLYKLNHTYGITPGDTCNMLYPFEIRQIDTLRNQPWDTINPLLKITVPANSYGYIKLPIKGYWPLRIEEQETIYDLKVYPNPANDVIKLIGSQNGSFYDGILQVRILSITGSLCLETSLTSGGFIDISPLSGGVYQIIAKFNDKEFVNKNFVKQ